MKLKIKNLFCMLIIILTMSFSCSNPEEGIPTTPTDNEGNLQKNIFESRGVDPDITPEADKVLFEIEPRTGLESRTYDEIKNQYPDKVILTIHNLIIPNDYIVDAINDYLVQNGKEYVVYFRDLTESDIKLLYVDNNERQLMEELIQSVDIIRLNRKYYYGMAKEGVLESWNEYLADEEGRSLYEALPENNWKDITIDGTIFGVTGYSANVVGPPSYTVNRDIMEKYNITEEELNKPINELEEILLKVAEGENENKSFHVLTVPSQYNFNQGISGTSYLLGSRAISLYDKPDQDAELIIEDPDYLRLLESMNNYANMGLVGEYSENISDFFIYIRFFSKLPHTNPWYGIYRDNKGELAKEEDVIEIFLSDYYGASLYKNEYANFIPAYSVNKAESFDFMKMVYSDPYITNLLLYGIENKNYFFEDGKITRQIQYVTDNTIGNTYLSYPLFYEYPDKKERYWGLQDSIAHPYHDFEFDPTEVEKEIQATNKVIEKLDKILSVGVEDFDAYIEDIKKQLYDSGVQKLLDEVNLQKNKWLEEKEQE